MVFARISGGLREGANSDLVSTRRHVVDPWWSDAHDSVKVVRHHDPGIEQKSVAQALAPDPLLRHDCSDVAQVHLTPSDRPEQATPIPGAHGDKVRGDASVIERGMSRAHCETLVARRSMSVFGRMTHSTSENTDPSINLLSLFSLAAVPVPSFWKMIYVRSHGSVMSRWSHGRIVERWERSVRGQTVHARYGQRGMSR